MKIFCCFFAFSLLSCFLSGLIIYLFIFFDATWRLVIADRRQPLPQFPTAAKRRANWAFPASLVPPLHPQSSELVVVFKQNIHAIPRQCFPGVHGRYFRLLRATCPHFARAHVGHRGQVNHDAPCGLSLEIINRSIILVSAEGKKNLSFLSLTTICVKSVFPRRAG